MDNDDKKMPDGQTELPYALMTGEGMLVGVLPDNIDYETFCETLTDGRYSQPGDIASIAICPGCFKGTQSGLLFGLQFAGPDGVGVERVEVGRIPYSAFLACVAAVVRCMKETDLLKHEPRGQILEALLDAEERHQQTLQ